MRRLPAAGSGAPCARLLAAARPCATPRATRLIPVLVLLLVLRTPGRRIAHAGTAVLLLRALSAAPALRAAACLVATIHRAAAGLVFAHSRIASTCFRLIRHRIAPENATPALRTH